MIASFLFTSYIHTPLPISIFVELSRNANMVTNRQNNAKNMIEFPLSVSTTVCYAHNYIDRVSQ